MRYLRHGFIGGGGGGGGYSVFISSECVLDKVYNMWAESRFCVIVKQKLV